MKDEKSAKGAKSVKSVFVSGSFDDLQSGQVRFLEEAAKLGRVHVLLWSDDAVREPSRQAPQVSPRGAAISPGGDPLRRPRDALDRRPVGPDGGAGDGDRGETGQGEKRRRGNDWCRLSPHLLFSPSPRLRVPRPPSPVPAPRSRVVVTGCYDWFHSGHVRFFEEVAALGNLYVVVGHDANIRLLKGEGHPMFPDHERQYMVQSIRHVTQALISTGDGWLDAEPEIERIKPDIYAVNEDGDRPEKRAYCEAHGIEYRVLKRVPKQGLPKRESRALRGF